MNYYHTLNKLNKSVEKFQSFTEMHGALNRADHNPPVFFATLALGFCICALLVSKEISDQN